MTDTDNRGCGPLGRFIRTFYGARRRASRTGDLSLLNPFIAADVRWSEPDVGAHMGVLEGRDAVLDMLRRALETTGGTFDLRVTSTLETSSHVAASIAWSAMKGGRRIEGEELAVFEVRDGRVAAAWFHPGDITDDEAFWGEGISSWACIIGTGHSRIRSGGDVNGSLELRITEREPFADSHPFEGAGPYERLVGRAHFAVDPDAPAYADVVDLDKVRRNSGGLVVYATDVCMLKPVGPGNRRLFFGYGNRGNKRELQFFNDAPASNDPRTPRDAGNGFLMRRGYAVVWAAWEGDLLPGDGRMLLDVPVARDGAEPLTGLVRSEFIADGPGVSTCPLSGWASTRSYPTVSLDTARASLTRRRYAGDAREPVASDHWAFARTEGGVGLDAQGAETALVESDTHIHVFDGFEPGWIYELVYTARDPRPYGIGHAVVRDLVSFLRYDETDGCGVANPLAGAIDRAYAWGRSQTGRCIRDFVYRGYNADARGRRVFDGVMPHVSGAGLMWMNHRFARVVNPAGQQYEDHENCADRFPFAYGPSVDHLTGREDAILKRPATDPLVLHTQSATEYWQRRGSLVGTVIS